jgi:hypothetical protein
MKTLAWKIQVLGIGFWIITLIFLSVGTGGCGKKEPPLSKEALSLKKEIKERIEKYSPVFLDPLSRGDKAAVQEALGKLSVEFTKGGQPLTWGAAVLDKDGITLGALTSGGPQTGLDYSNMKPVAEVLKNRKMVQGKFYRKDGFNAYYVVGPLLRKEELVGLFVLGLPTKEVNEKRGISEKEFMAIDFNN